VGDFSYICDTIFFSRSFFCLVKAGVLFLFSYLYNFSFTVGIFSFPGYYDRLFWVGGGIGLGYDNDMIYGHDCVGLE